MRGAFAAPHPSLSGNVKTQGLKETKNTRRQRTRKPFVKDEVLDKIVDLSLLSLSFAGPWPRTAVEAAHWPCFCSCIQENWRRKLVRAAFKRTKQNKVKGHQQESLRVHPNEVHKQGLWFEGSLSASGGGWGGGVSEGLEGVDMVVARQPAQEKMASRGSLDATLRPYSGRCHWEG